LHQICRATKCEKLSDASILLLSMVAPWWHGLRWSRLHSSTVAWPHPMEHHAQPHKGDHRQLVEKEIGDHGKPLSYKCCNEGILPGFQTVGISRRLEVHNPSKSWWIYESMGIDEPLLWSEDRVENARRFSPMCQAFTLLQTAIN